MADPIHEIPLRKPARTFASFWGHGGQKSLKKAWDKYNAIIVLAFILWTFAIVVLRKHPTWLNATFWGFDMSTWVQYLIPVVLLIVFLGWHWMRAPYEIYLEQHRKHEEEIADKDKLINKAIAKLQSIEESIPILEIRAAFCIAKHSGDFICRIGVRNKSTTATARLVKVELLDIDPAPNLKAHAPFGVVLGDVPYPIALMSSDFDGNTIHPECVSTFDLFNVHRQRVPGHYDRRAVVSVDISRRPLFIDERFEALKYLVGGFHPELKEIGNPEAGYKEYRVKIRASAEGTPPTTVRFKVLFVMDAEQDAVQIIGAPYEITEQSAPWKSFDDIPDVVCKRLLRSKDSFLQALKSIKDAEDKSDT